MINNNCLKEKLKVFVTILYTKCKNLLSYFAAFIALIFLGWFIYTRFMREHLPRDIPFILTELWFYSIICLCLIHLYGIKSAIKPSIPKPWILTLLFYLSIIIKPFLILDNLLKTNRFTFKHVLNSIKYIVPPGGGKGRRIFLFVFHITPRIVLVSIFLMDIFWFDCLNNFYYYLFLGILPLIYNYYKYSMYQIKEFAIQYLESIYMHDYVDIHEVGWDEPSIRYEDDEFGETREILIEPVWQPHPRNKYHFKIVSIREYVKIILEKDIDEIENKYEDSYELDPNPMPKKHIFAQYKTLHNKIILDENDDISLSKEFKFLMLHINYVDLSLHYLPRVEKWRYFSVLNGLISFSFLIGWVYILITSIHTLNGLPITIEILQTLTEHIMKNNPFIE